MYTEEYWELSRMRTALKLMTISEVLAAFGNNMNTICSKMRNKARAIDKVFISCTRITKACFLDLMNDVDFDVRSWNVRLIDTNNIELGFNFSIDGFDLKYHNEPKAICTYPIKCITEYRCEYSNICKSPLSKKRIYTYDRIFKKRAVVVNGFHGYVDDWEETINGKSYSEWPEESYERINFASIRSKVRDIEKENIKLFEMFNKERLCMK